MNNATTPEQSRAKLIAAMDRATARAIEMAESGIRPVLNKSEMARDGLSQLQRWVVPSRTTAGTLYSVTLVADAGGLHTECSCQAGESGKPCWHRALARRASLHEAPYTDSRRPTMNVTRERKADAQGWYETFRCGTRQVTIRPRSIGAGDQAIYFDHEVGRRVKVEYGQAGHLRDEAEAWLTGAEQTPDAPDPWDAEAYAAVS
jgi:hypothetical protein